MEDSGARVTNPAPRIIDTSEISGAQRYSLVRLRGMVRPSKFGKVAGSRAASG